MQKLLNLFGMAKRASSLYLGQDKIIEALRCGTNLIIFVTNDVSENVLRKFTAASERGTAELYRIEVDRKTLGNALGTTTAQAAALVRDNGFAKSAVKIFREYMRYAEQRSDANG